MRTTLLIFTMFLLLGAAVVRGELVVSHSVNTSKEDARMNYFNELLILALEKTRATYGDYQFKPIPGAVPRRRFHHQLKSNVYENLTLALPYNEAFTELTEFVPIHFPTDLGILGYRVCFVNPAIKEQIRAVKTLDELRRYTIIQGENWADVPILRANNFKVMEVDGYPTIFKMVVGGRADLFCRGVNELLKEYDAYKNIGNLTYDENFLLEYQTPRFFYIHKANVIAKQRIEKGLDIAYKDGSLLQLWLTQFKTSIVFAKLKQRKVFKLDNIALKNLPPDYKKYHVDPLTIE
jgi:hypothetical protein